MKRGSIFSVLLVALLLASFVVGSNIQAEDESWKVQLEVTTSPDIGSAIVTFGVDPGATAGFDSDLDDAAPPAPPEGISAYFWYPENTPSELRKLATSYIPPDTELVWTLKIKYIKEGPAEGDVTISWNPGEVPSAWSLLLRDKDDATTLADMKAVNSYTFHAEVPEDESSETYTFVVKALRAQVHDVGIALDYAGAVGGIKITRDGTDVVGADENLIIGQTYKIRYKLVNKGDFDETIAVTVKVDDITLATHNYSLHAGDSNTYADEWDTSGLSEGTHTITVTATLADDVDTSDNERTRNVTLVVMPAVAFSSNAYQVNEDAGTTTIEVVLSQATGQTVTVHYATSDGTATAPDDYTAASGTLTFNPGETSKTFTVTIIDDGLAEGDETVNLALSNPTNAELGAPSTAVLTIVDNDVAPQVVSTSPEINATDVPVDANITAAFNKDIDPTTINTNTFLLEDAAGNPVAGTVSYDAVTKTAIFDPADNLEYGTTYTATITTGVKDTDGNALAADYSWSFTTEAAPQAGAWAEPSVLALAGLGPRVKQVLPDKVQVVVAGETVEVDVAELKDLVGQYEERLPEGYGPLQTAFHVTTTGSVDGVTLNLEQFLRNLFPDDKMQEILGDAYADWGNYLTTFSSAAMEGSGTEWSYSFDLFEVFDYLMKWFPEDSGILEFNKAGVAKFGQVMSAVATGKYAIPVTAVKDGETVAETQIELSVVDFLYALEPGWNAVALPLIPTANNMNVQGMLDASGAEFGLGKDIDSIVRWNAESQRWEQYAVVGGEAGWYDGGGLAAPDTTVPALETLFVHANGEGKSLGLIFAPAARNLAYGYFGIAADILGGESE